ncbi:MAG TPA: TspO/MBR family protein [Nocardioidaceae bacterium]|jgi:tryptophan-rich sensory protein
MPPRNLLATGVAAAATALAGGLASRDVRSGWYAALDKPSFQPPPVAFPLAWTALYTDIAVTSAAALDRLGATGAGEERRALRLALGANLVVNASWTWVFFAAHRLGLASGVAAVLTASSADLVRRTARADRRAGLALVPYPLWCGFATVLSTTIWRRNRR